MKLLDKPRFLITSVAVSVLIFVLDVWFHGTFASQAYAGYPMRPMDQIMGLFPFLFATYVVQLSLFCFLFLRLYPSRGLPRAAWWGLWGGFFVVIPNMQFFVSIRDTSWSILAMQVVEGMALTVLTAILFELAYRPRLQSGLASQND